MGKRKKSSRKPGGPKKNEPLPTSFSCLFCNHEKSVNVKLDKKAMVGALDCKVCGQQFQCSINYLSAAVDVYGEWVDAADAVAQEHAEAPAPTLSGPHRPTPRNITRVQEDDDDDEGDMGYEGDGIVGDDIID